jgi:hypothetical protein
VKQTLVRTVFEGREKSVGEKQKHQTGEMDGHTLQDKAAPSEEIAGSPSATVCGRLPAN